MSHCLEFGARRPPFHGARAGAMAFSLAAFSQWVRGMIFLVMMVGTATIGVCFLMCPVEFLLKPIMPELAHYITHQVFHWWLTLDAALAHLIVGFPVRMVSDTVESGTMDPSESAILMINHRTEIDWTLLFHFGYRIPESCVTLRVVLKNMLCHVPGIGWSMRMLGYAFVARRWELDKAAIEHCIQRYTSKKLPLWLIIFPEGTALYWRSLERNTKFMEAKGLKPFKYVLMPREKGFIHCIRKMGPQTAVYDLTVGFPSIRDHDKRPSLKSLANGELPEVDVHVRRYGPEDVPHGADDDTVAQWLHKRFQEKEQLLEKYYNTAPAGRPPCGFPGVPLPSKHYSAVALWLVIGFWALLTYGEIRLAMWSHVAFYWQMFCMVVFITWNFWVTRKAKRASKKF